jgi:hypothetical protein
MKYILMMVGTRADEKAAGIFNWPAADVSAHIAFLRRFNAELTATGELVAVEALAGTETTRIVRAAADGRPVITDGPFAEAKEFLVGYWIVDVASTERAYEIAARASAAPGLGGAPLNMPIEVRPVIAAPHQ